MERYSVEEIFDIFRNNRKKIEIPLEELKQELKSFEGKIVLYGAGSAGIAFLHYLRDAQIFPRFFADGDTAKHGKACEGLEIISPESIVQRVGKQALVIVTINTDGKNYCKDFKTELLIGGHNRVHENLHNCGCENVVDYTYFRRCYQLFRGGKYNLPACSDIELMLENKGRIEKAYEVLEEGETRDTFLLLLMFRLLKDEVEIPTYPEGKMYFEFDLFPQLTDEVFVDCGACGGSSLENFLKANQHHFQKYYGIEPDRVNYEKLHKYVNALNEEDQEKIEIICAAAYSHEKGTSFFVLDGPGTFQMDEGPQFVKTAKIDHILNGKRATYIKMNIEGSEVAALKGAETTIRKYQPRLAIMGYHKTSDLWEIPLLIHEYNSEYHITLRSYMKNVAFTYYAY